MPIKRAPSITALIKKAKEGSETLRSTYAASLSERLVREDLKVEVKNIFENLRSCLDYLAHEIHENYCSQHQKPDRLYFPIRQNATDFDAAVQRDFPGLEVSNKALVEFLKSVQPFNDPWLRDFNQLNNHNKHQDLVPQTRTEAQYVNVKSPEGGEVSWGPGVQFGQGVSVLGVPIDPRTQLPIPNNTVRTTIQVWIDFKFADIDESVLPFVQTSIAKVEAIFEEISKLSTS